MWCVQHDLYRDVHESKMVWKEKWRKREEVGVRGRRDDEEVTRKGKRMHC